MAGIAGDAKQLVNKARSEARGFREFYGSQIPGKVLNERLAYAFAIPLLLLCSVLFGCNRSIDSHSVCCVDVLMC